MCSRRAWFAAALALLLATAVYALHLGVRVDRAFAAHRWDAPARVYAAPLELYAGLALTPQVLTAELERLGYLASDAAPQVPGSFRREGARVALFTRQFRFWDGEQAARRLVVDFDGGAIAALHDPAGGRVPLARLDPLLLGNLYTADGEDRIIVREHEIPALLVDALKAVEDRRFDTHHGVDPAAVARALLVNLRHGEVQQGGSTLTQQLVKSLYLDNERTLWRKAREAVMAVALELRHAKQDLLTAYVNEVYLGQDGPRAVHGFGLASQHYFGKPLEELDVHEIALLVAVIRGPSWYNPRQHPQRARERRDLVLSQMAAQGVISAAAAASASDRALALANEPGRSSRYYPAFMQLVHQQLREGYAEEALASAGLQVFTSFEPLAQRRAEQALATGLTRLERARGLQGLEGAVVITRPHDAEVLALVGGRRSGFDGFNRALQAHRQVGSLIKPLVYLAALESGRYTLASVLDDRAIEVRQEGDRRWSPQNFAGEEHGEVSLLRALTESMNLATVRLGLEVGVERVAALFPRLGLAPPAHSYPSLLLGAVDLTPLEVAQLYNTLANGGFRLPLRAIRAVATPAGDLLQRYGLEVAQGSDPVAVFQLNQALVQVMERGTGRRARQRLPPALVVAGKTGTSDELRDSWFAGFGASHLAVVWVGDDANRPRGLTGAAGALGIWTDIMRQLPGVSAYSPPVPDGLVAAEVDYAGGGVARELCPGRVRVALPRNATPARAHDCARPLRTASPPPRVDGRR